jgi:C-terminal processing protease CtpA/Prc
MGIVEAYGLGAIMGAPTAGANGNVTRLTLPSDHTLTWTGMRVLKQDGSQHHLVGVRPTLPAAPTVAAIRVGRNEVLERGIAAVSD